MHTDWWLFVYMLVSRDSLRPGFKSWLLQSGFDSMLHMGMSFTLEGCLPSGLSSTITKAQNCSDSNWDCHLRLRLAWPDIDLGDIKHGFVFCLGSSLTWYLQVASFFWHLLFFHLLGAALLIDEYDCAEDDDFSADTQERPEGGELICSTRTIFFHNIFEQSTWIMENSFSKITQ